MNKINLAATDYLNRLIRVRTIANGIDPLETPSLLFPPDASLFYTSNDLIRTQGLGNSDIEERDLLSHIKILDALNVKYLQTNVLMPRAYAEGLSPIPHHISIQAIVFSRLERQSLNQVFQLLDDTQYNKTENDRIWVEDNNPRKILKPGDVVIIMNRRVGGWDGDKDRPVIELLGGGGHLPTVWSAEKKAFVQMDPVDALIKEFNEELKYPLSSQAVQIMGGFHNRVSNELVILCAVSVPSDLIVSIQKGALNNLSESIDGIYLGTLKGVLKRYLENADAYAGGEKAKASNFPSRRELMKRVYASLGIDD